VVDVERTEVLQNEEEQPRVGVHAHAPAARDEAPATPEADQEHRQDSDRDEEPAGRDSCEEAHEREKGRTFAG